MNIFLNSDSKTRAHRQLKRHLEIVRILEELEPFLQDLPQKDTMPQILEFGCGNGFQISYLKKFGKVFATDIYRSKEMLEKYAAFCESSVTSLPFPDGIFDVIFSSHVVEHLPQPERAFSELHRVAKKECLFVFSVPTNFWLLLSLPAKLIGKMNGLFGILALRKKDKTAEVDSQDLQKRKEMEERLAEVVRKRPSLIESIMPKGHGVYQRFGECYRAFRVRAWSLFFQEAGFTIHTCVPLFLYGPSERPLVPITSWPARFGICSSVLFIMGKTQRNQ